MSNKHKIRRLSSSVFLSLYLSGCSSYVYDAASTIIGGDIGRGVRAAGNIMSEKEIMDEQKRNQEEQKKKREAELTR